VKKVEQIVHKALEGEEVMGFAGLTAFSKAQDYLRKKNLIPKGEYPVQVVKTKLDGSLYACCLFGDIPNDVWCVLELIPHFDAYIGDTFKTRVRGTITGLEPKENTDG